MMPVDDTEKQIARDEAWFGRVCADPDPPSIERIRARVRLAVNEEWLSRRLSDSAAESAAPDATVAAKAAVRAVIARQAGGPTVGRFSRVRLLKWIGGVTTAAAASLALVAVIDRPTTVSEPLSYLDAFAAYDDDELTATLASLRDEVTALEVSWDDTGLGDESGLGDFGEDGSEPTGAGGTQRG